MAYLYTFLLSMLGGAIGASIYLIINHLVNKKIQNDIQEDERKEICRILNVRKDILVRYKNCETTTYYAHIAIHKDTEEYIMIDLD